jgi:hypothetical protein
MQNILGSTADLEEYCLRRLGKPVINIEIDQTQLCDRIDDALQYYIERHFDGSEEVYYKHVITSSDVTRGYIELPEEIITIVDIIESDFFSTELFENIRYIFMQQSMLDWTQPSVLNYYLTKEHIATINNQLTPERSFRFNGATHILQPHMKLIEGDFLLLHGFTAVDYELYTDVFNDRWLKKYATVLVKEQWGANVKKFDGVQMPGGVTLNGKEIWDEAVDERKELETEFSNMYELPASGIVG